MRRKLRDLKEAIVNAVRAQIFAGNGRHSTLVSSVKLILQTDPNISLSDLLQLVAARETSAAKQELRANGEIEIGDGTKAKPVADLNEVDIEKISCRGFTNLHGSLINNIRFHHKHGRIDDCRTLLSMYSALAPDEARALKEELGLVD